jgi:MFS family permease
MLNAMSLDLFSVFFGGVSALLPVYALDILHVGAQGLGIMRMTMSAGAALTMLVAVRFPPMGRPWRNLLIAAGGFGCCILGFAFSTNFLLSLLLLFGQGAFDSISILVRTTLVPLLTPEHMRGRVAAVGGMFIASSAEVGDFESGTMASLLGTMPAVFLGGCITLGVVLFTFLRTPQMTTLSLDELTRAPEPQPAGNSTHPQDHEPGNQTRWRPAVRE